MTMAPVSVVIRNLNEGKDLRKVLQALQSQRSVPAETIVVDNESTDESRLVMEEYGVRVISIARTAFTYGKALNVGVAEATQPFVLNLSAHSVPLGRNFIDDMLEPFSDPVVGAVTCHNVANKHDLAEWPAERRLIGDVDWPTLIHCGLINSAAAIRRDLWERFPFDEHLPFSEDTLWSRKILSSGYAIATSTAMYVYLVDRSFLDEIQRRDRERIALYKITGIRPSYSPRRFIRAFFVRGPRAGLRVMAFECLSTVSMLTVPFRARVKTLAANEALSSASSKLAY
jgi:rhamnosyltransferase